MLNPTTLPPGFRFHPTDEELILHYLRNRAASMPLPVSIIAEVDIYKFDPWDLPAKALFGDREWYFFSPRDRKYPNGVRPNRAAASGYWKATGTDKPIVMSKGIINGNSIGVKKALVFYKGRPPKGVKTDWIMHEYRLADALMSSNNVYKPIKLRSPSMRLDDWVLCRIYKKSTHQVSLDPEQEDSGVECVAASPQSTQHNSFLKLPKSCSLSELLDAADYSAIARLLETPPDLLGSENCSFGYPNSSQPFIHGSNSSFTQQLSQTQSPVLITDNMLKRKLQTANSCFEDDGELSCSAKKPTTVSRMFTCFSDHFDNTQLINHQLLNSQQTEELYKM